MNLAVFDFSFIARFFKKFFQFCSEFAIFLRQITIRQIWNLFAMTTSVPLCVATAEDRGVTIDFVAPLVQKMFPSPTAGRGTF